jgi:hypothetical protein
MSGNSAAVTLAAALLCGSFPAAAQQPAVVDRGSGFTEPSGVAIDAVPLYGNNTILQIR